MINGSKRTITWYVDNNKISHVDPDVVTAIILKIEERFGKMTVTRGKEHVFLGMKFVFKENETVKVSMRSYLKESIAESNLQINKVAPTPSRRDLLEVNNSSLLLSKEEAEVFHSVVAKLLYVSLRARPDISLTVSFLCSRVSKSTRQDQEKLKRLLEYIYGTLDLTLTVGADDLGKIHTWVDASYAVHPDMRSHTGGVISMGTGVVINRSSKQKISTKSSTEAELVGATDFLPPTIWSKMFLEAQGHKVESNIIHQDNMSAIRLEVNGRSSTGKQSRHIHIRYFFMKDRVKQENISVTHCPTESMLADFLTKPLQGLLFRMFRDVLLGYRHISTLTQKKEVNNIRAPFFEERVGMHENEDRNNEQNAGVRMETPNRKCEVRTEVRRSSTGKSPGNVATGSTETDGDNTVDSTWTLVTSTKKKKFTDDRKTKINKGGSVCEVHKFTNNPIR
jgi:hypothetical protein